MVTDKWNTDRFIEIEAATVGLTGLALGVLARPAFLAVTAVAAGAVFVHATQGWYPWLPVLRRLGLRTAREIARERYALKALRGDFADMDRVDDHGAEQTLAATDSKNP